MDKLSETQTNIVSRWIADGFGLAEVQTKLRDELALNLTYMETRFLVDDLKLTPKDKAEPAMATEPALETASESENLPSPLDPMSPPTGSLRVTLDQITRPQAIVSGKVVFSDGQGGAWYLDQLGRLGLDADTPGYRPSEKDLMDFQIELQRVVQGAGF